MAVAKRQGREKPAEIEQRKVWGPEWGPQVEQTALLESPIYLGQAQGEEKHIERGAKGLSLSLPPSLPLSLLLAGMLPHSLLSASLGRHALPPQGWIFLLFSK